MEPDISTNEPNWGHDAQTAAESNANIRECEGSSGIGDATDIDKTGKTKEAQLDPNLILRTEGKCPTVGETDLIDSETTHGFVPSKE